VASPSKLRWSLQSSDKRLLLRLLVRVSIAIALVFVAFVTIFEYSIWQFNRLSPEFRMAARLAFEAIRQCEPSADESASDFGSRLEDAEKKLAALEPLDKTQGDRRVRIMLRGYLHRAMKCREQRENSKAPVICVMIARKCCEIAAYSTNASTGDVLRNSGQGTKSLPVTESQVS